MEKRKPNYDLERFKAVAGDARTLDLTGTAILSARSIGFEIEQIAALIRTMTRQMFYKSMTSYRDHKLWQDVYHVPSADGLTIYLKFTANIVTEFTVLSFKERT
jgi:motility quorum-sensing regulator/GCU-specific mRNA interferase toxin